MKLFIASLIGLIGFAFAPSIEKTDKTISPQNSEVRWIGKKVTGEHSGVIKVKEGFLSFEGENLVGGKVVIDMNSIECKDLQGEAAGKLVGHLKSDDFFGVKQHPTATFVISQVISRGKPGDYKVVGDMQIKGIKKSVKVQARVMNSKGVKVDLTIDRSDFNIKYGSGSFFDNLGDKTIYDEFDLSMTLAFNK